VDLPTFFLRKSVTGNGYSASMGLDGRFTLIRQRRYGRQDGYNVIAGGTLALLPRCCSPAWSLRARLAMTAQAHGIQNYPYALPRRGPWRNQQAWRMGSIWALS
jgi:hypothetical protein